MLIQPMFGIVIPTYNRSPLLERALLSVLAQDYPNWTICVVDDGSSDDTEAMISTYTDNSKIHYIKQPKNLGVNSARNVALHYLLEEIHCDYITLLDDDDYFNQATLSTALKYIHQFPNQEWFISKRVTEDGKNITMTKKQGLIPYIEYYLGLTMKGDATHVIKSTLIAKTRFSRQFMQAQEWLFFINLAQRSEMFYYDFPSTVCRYLEDGLSAQINKKSNVKSDQDLRLEVLKKKALLNLGYSFENVELLKLHTRIKNILEDKKYHKMFRYLPKYLYWYFLNSIKFPK